MTGNGYGERYARAYNEERERLRALLAADDVCELCEGLGDTPVADGEGIAYEPCTACDGNGLIRR